MENIPSFLLLFLPLEHLQITHYSAFLSNTPTELYRAKESTRCTCLGVKQRTFLLQFPSKLTPLTTPGTFKPRTCCNLCAKTLITSGVIGIIILFVAETEVKFND